MQLKAYSIDFDNISRTFTDQNSRPLEIVKVEKRNEILFRTKNNPSALSVPVTKCSSRSQVPQVLERPSGQVL